MAYFRLGTEIKLLFYSQKMFSFVRGKDVMFVSSGLYNMINTISFLKQ